MVYGNKVINIPYDFVFRFVDIEIRNLRTLVIDVYILLSFLY